MSQFVVLFHRNLIKWHAFEAAIMDDAELRDYFTGLDTTQYHEGWKTAACLLLPRHHPKLVEMAYRLARDSQGIRLGLQLVEVKWPEWYINYQASPDVETVMPTIAHRSDQVRTPAEMRLLMDEALRSEWTEDAIEAEWNR
jgi:hypothetical protein